MDLGTSSVLVYDGGDIVLHEPSIVAIMVDEQKIVEMGSHEQLIKKKGSYFQMYETWEKQEEEKREEIL